MSGTHWRLPQGEPTERGVRDEQSWTPTRFVRSRRGYRASRQVPPGSRFMANTVIRSYVPLLEEHARGKLLDLGCGLVPYHAIYRKKITSSVCVDWPSTHHENPHVDVHADLNAALPFSGASFDTVLLTDVLEHIARPEPLMRECARVLRPGGKVVVTVPFFYWLHEEPHDYYRYTEHALRRFCREAGLDVVSLEPTGGLPEICMDLVVKNVAFSKLLTRALAAWFGFWSRRWPARAISRKTQRVFPLGYCLVARKPDWPTADSSQPTAAVGCQLLTGYGTG